MIKITQRMLNKSIMDANKKVQDFFAENIPSVSYANIPYGHKRIIGDESLMLKIPKRDDFKVERMIRPTCFADGDPCKISLYRRPRGDELIWVSGLTKRAKVSDTLSFELRNETLVVHISEFVFDAPPTKE